MLAGIGGRHRNGSFLVGVHIGHARIHIAGNLPVEQIGLSVEIPVRGTDYQIHAVVLRRLHH